MKKYITYFLMAAALIGGATACNEDDLTKESSFDNMTPYRTAFDEWLLDNYVTPYNIDFKYKFEYKESDTDYNLAPAELSKSVAMAKLVKYLWIDAYVEVQGNNRDFICTYGPKMIHLIGSPAYDNGKITLGTAEGGLKVTLYNINALNPNSVDVEMMNRWKKHYKNITAAYHLSLLPLPITQLAGNLFPCKIYGKSGILPINTINLSYSTPPVLPKMPIS